MKDRLIEIAERVHAESNAQLAQAEARMRDRWPADGGDPAYRWCRGAMLTTMDFMESADRLEAAGLTPNNDPDFYRRLYLLEICQPVEAALGPDLLHVVDDEVSAWAPELGHPVNGVDAAARAHLFRYLRLSNPDASEDVSRTIREAICDGVNAGVQRAIMRRVVGPEMECKFWKDQSGTQRAI